MSVLLKGVGVVGGPVGEKVVFIGGAGGGWCVAIGDQEVTEETAEVCRRGEKPVRKGHRKRPEQTVVARA